MANFAVVASEEVITRGNRLLEKLAGPVEKKMDTLVKMFSLAENAMENNQLREQGMDVEGLDAAFMHIRNMFLAVVSAKEELKGSYERNIEELGIKKEKMELDLRTQLDTANLEKKNAVQAAEECRKEMQQIQKEMTAAKEQLDIANHLVEEIEKIAVMLTAKLAEAEKSAEAYPSVYKAMVEQKEKIRELEQKILSAEKENDHKIRTMEIEHTLAMERALMVKEREYIEELRKSDKENARLTAKIEQLENLINDGRKHSDINSDDVSEE